MLDEHYWEPLSDLGISKADLISFPYTTLFASGKIAISLTETLEKPLELQATWNYDSSKFLQRREMSGYHLQLTVQLQPR